jgi:Mg2+ and Co2+ transporter CorA
MLNDLVYYLRNHSSQVDLTHPDTSVYTFVNKIVTSHYLKHCDHLRATLSYVQRGLSRKQDLAKLTMDQVEELWSDIQVWERRMSEYCEDLEAIMLQLRVPLERQGLHFVGDGGGAAHWTDSTTDYQFLLMRFRELRHRTECLNSAITGLANIAGNRQAFKEQQLAVQEAKRSIREAKSTKAVTLLGLVFIPLAYASSIFSMSEPFRPGDRLFWVYFAASAPLIVLVMVGYYLLDWGYTDDGQAWSPKTFRRSVEGRMGLQKLTGSFVIEETKAS